MSLFSGVLIHAGRGGGGSLLSGVLIHSGGEGYVDRAVYIMSFTMGGRVSRECLLFPLNWQCVTNLASHNAHKIAVVLT